MLYDILFKKFDINFTKYWSFYEKKFIRNYVYYCFAMNLDFLWIYAHSSFIYYL